MAVRVGEHLKQLTQQLAPVSDTAQLDAEVLLGFVLQQTRTWLYTWLDRELNKSQLQQLEALLARRLRGEPVAYLTGQREFWSLLLDVSPNTLIPRPETELLVELSLELFEESSAERRILDLGTGAGAIALAIASERPNWRITGVDRVPEAVVLAQRNRQRLNLPHVEFLQSDWFESVDEAGFDLIVSNPPYIDALDPHLEQGDVRFEPRSALVADEDGLRDIKQIIADAPRYLAPQGWLLFEHGYQQADAVQQLFKSRGFSAVQSHQDLAGHARATLGQWLG